MRRPTGDRIVTGKRERTAVFCAILLVRHPVKSTSELTRRSFVKTPAFALGGPALLSSQSPSDQLRVGIIGVGGRGTSLLRRIVLSPGVKLVAICDIDPQAVQRALEIAKEHNPETISDYRRLLDRKDIDAVFVATPVNLHKEMAVAALEVHKHLYLEKPIDRKSTRLNSSH